MSQIVHPWHKHPLNRDWNDDGWACDGRNQQGGCRRGITDFRQTTGVPRWRCIDCDFDLCDKCIADPPNTEVTHPWHKHKLIRNMADDGWACDGRTQLGGCRRGITDFRQTAGVPRWRCVECDFDLCDKCIADPPRDQAPPSPSPPVSPRSPKSKTPEHTIVKPGTSAPSIDSFDSHFVEERFRRQVDKALTTVKTTLHNEREPTYPADVAHSYEDKYALAEFLTSGALAGELNCFESLGLTDKHLKRILKWAESRSVTIRLKADEKCKFDREETRKVESSTEHVTEVKSSILGAFKRTDKVITKITEYFWKFDVEYELFVFKGNDPDEKIVLQTRRAGCEIVTTTKSTPRPEVRVVPSMDLNITWALQQIDAEKSMFKFAVDRKSDECRTPRRNPQIYAALNHFAAFGTWARSVYSYFVDSLFPAQANHGLDLASLHANSIFVPVQPLFEEHASKDKDNEASPKSAALIALPAGGAPAAASVVLPIGDLNTFLWEQKRSMSEKLSELAKLFPAPADAKLISLTEANVLLVMQHSTKLAQHYSDSVDYIEDMLYKQLVAAIGKVITPADFANYMRFHNRKLFRGAFEPRPFCYAVRRPDHYPEGTVTIESQLSDGSLADPVFTTSRRITGAEAVPMRFPINAATNVVFGGDRYIHASVFHQFAGNSGQSLSLLARARQFSSFILIVGRIASAQVFDPKAAIVIQNKDDLKIPLLLETIPTAKEFKDAIESMSEEQQRFCKAYRAMQLESTLFGMVVIQIKPQLEKLLNLPYDSLTKEIRLTQDLMEMFIKYQIPSDQLSFDPLYCNQQNPTKEVKIAQVKKNVKAMQSMIEDSQKKEIEEAAKKAAYDALELSKSYEQEERSYRYEEKKEMSRSPRGGKGAAPLRLMAKAATALPGAPAPKPAQSSAVSSAPRPAAPAPAPAPAPAQPQAQPATSEPAKPTEAPQGEVELAGEDDELVGIDFTKIPAALDAQYEALDEDAALRPTIINISPSWTKKYQKALLAQPETQIMNTTEQSSARNVAFDLLDALTRSGSLAIDYAELHIFIAATHCFEHSIVDTVVQDNINPIEKIERSVLIMASTVQDKPVVELIKADQVERVQTYSPMLFPAQERPAIADK